MSTKMDRKAERGSDLRSGGGWGGGKEGVCVQGSERRKYNLSMFKVERLKPFKLT